MPRKFGTISFLFRTALKIMTTETLSNLPHSARKSEGGQMTFLQGEAKNFKVMQLTGNMSPKALQ